MGVFHGASYSKLRMWRKPGSRSCDRPFSCGEGGSRIRQAEQGGRSDSGLDSADAQNPGPAGAKTKLPTAWGKSHQERMRRTWDPPTPKPWPCPALFLDVGVCK